MNNELLNQDLKVITSSLASIDDFRIDIGKNESNVFASVRTTPDKIEAGKYIIFFGTKQLSLHIDAADADHFAHYDAHIAEKNFKEQTSDAKNSANSLSASVAGSVHFPEVEAIKAHAKTDAATQFKSSHQEKTEEKKIFPLIVYAGGKWRIGSRAGDPSKSDRTKPQGFESALDGKYFSGGDWEVPNLDPKAKSETPLCKIKRKYEDTTNDIGITLTLVCEKSDLIVTSTINENIREEKNTSKSFISALAKLNPLTESPVAKLERVMRDKFAEFCLIKAKDSDPLKAKHNLKSSEMILNQKYKRYGS